MKVIQAFGRSHKSPSGVHIAASPLARGLAARHEIDLAAVKGTGPKGWIVKADIEQALNKSEDSPNISMTPLASRVAALSGLDLTPLAQVKGSNRVRLSDLIGQNDQVVHEISKPEERQNTTHDPITEGNATAPHLSLQRDIGLSAAIELCKHLNALAPGAVRSVIDVLIYAVARSLQKFPIANANWDGAALCPHEEVDITLPIVTEIGISTPVIRSAQSLSITEVAEARIDAARRCTAEQIVEEGNFAIFNHDLETRVRMNGYILKSNVAALSICKTQIRHFEADEKTINEPEASLILLYDRRVIDGALGVSVLNAIGNLIEEPATLLL